MAGRLSVVRMKVRALLALLLPPAPAPMGPEPAAAPEAPLGPWLASSVG